MKCSIDDCQKETHHRCGLCGEPVCVEHGATGLAGRVFPNKMVFPAAIMGPMRGYEYLCPSCAKLQEEQEQAREHLSVA